MPSAQPTPAEQPAPKPAEAEDSFATHVLSIVSALMGAMFLTVFVLLHGATFLMKEKLPTGLGIENTNYILAIGVGLLVLGIGLQFHTILDFLQQRRSWFALNSLALGVLAFVLLILVNYVATRQNLWRWDLTSEQRFTLTEESLALIRGLDEDVRLLVIMPMDDPRIPVEELDLLVDQYVTASPRITSTRISPETLPREEQEKLMEELDASTYSDLFGVAVQVGRNVDGEFVALRSRLVQTTDLWTQEFSGGAPHMVSMGEQKISSAILDVTRGKSPRIYFLEGHEETSFTDFQARDGLGALGRILRSKNYDLAPLNLRTAERPVVPDDADALVIAGPRRELSETEVKAIQAYLDRGGDALLLLEPVLHRPVAGQPRQYVPSGLAPMLRRYGVEALDETLMFLQQDPTTGRQYVVPHVPGLDYGAEADDQHAHGPLHVIVRDIEAQDGAVLFFSARPLRVTPGGSGGAKVTELVKTSPEQTQLMYRVRDPREATESDLRPGGVSTLAVAIEEEREGGSPTRIVVLGDVDVANNEFVQGRRYHNLELIQNSIAWLVQAEDRIVGKASRPKSFRLDMQIGQAYFFALLGLFGLPSIPIGLGVFVWLLRRK